MVSSRAISVLLIALGCFNSAAGQDLSFDDGQDHVLTDAADSVFVTNQSTLDVRSTVPRVGVDDATLFQNGGVIGTIFAEAETLNIGNGANASLNSGRVYGVSVDAATLTLNGSVITGVNTPAVPALDLRNGAVVELNSGSAGSSNEAFPSIVAIDSHVQVAGASVVGINTFRGASTVSVNAGMLSSNEDGNILAADTTMVTITGGSVQSGLASAIRLNDAAMLKLQGGTIKADTGISARGQSAIEMTGGSVNVDAFMSQGIDLSGDSQLHLSAGTVEGLTAISARGNAKINMSGGALRFVDGGGVRLSGRASAEITGGTISIVEGEFGGSFLSVGGSSQISIYGSGFNFPLHEPIESLSGEITGALSDGTAIAWTFVRDDSASIVLVPEPDSLLCFAIGLYFMSACLRRLS